MGKVLLTVPLDPGHATLDAARERLGVSDDDLDTDFGVVSIDPDANLYAVLVDEAAAGAAAARPSVEGPFSNPRIETFGPPKPSSS